MHLILTGATGTVGTAVLHNLLHSPTISKISILSRRPVLQAEGHEKVNVIIHKDFSKYDEVTMRKLEDADGVIWALGVSQNSVGKEDYINITKTYTTTFATSLSSHLTRPATFIFISGEGATWTPGTFTPIFGRIKGETEKSLLALQTPKLSVLIARPGAVDPTAQPEIQKFLPGGWMEMAKRPVYALFRGVVPGMVSPTRPLAEALVKLATGGGGKVEGIKGVEGQGRVVSNVGLRALVGL